MGGVLLEISLQLDGPVRVVCALLAVIVAVWLAAGLRHRFRDWRWWQIVSFLAGTAAVAAAVLTPLESLGRRDLLTAHVAQHIVLGDAAAPLLLLGLPPEPRRWLRGRLARLSRDPSRAARLLCWTLSPVGALVAWALAAYAWYTPALHRLAVTGGPVHVLDHLSFLGFGMLIWLGAFDPREPRPLRRGLRDGGLPWWARHAYAMCSRVAMRRYGAAAGRGAGGWAPCGLDRSCPASAPCRRSQRLAWSTLPWRVQRSKLSRSSRAGMP
ncbi:MAG: cytochrome c oxidase assembly protein [Solirubrobacteraceae bacterium]